MRLEIVMFEELIVPVRVEDDVGAFVGWTVGASLGNRVQFEEGCYHVGAERKVGVGVGSVVGLIV